MPDSHAKRKFRIAAIQMTSGQDVDSNLNDAAELIAEAARAGADWVALPEMFAYLRKEGEAFPCAQSLEGEIVGFIAPTPSVMGSGCSAEASRSGRQANGSTTPVSWPIRRARSPDSTDPSDAAPCARRSS